MRIFVFIVILSLVGCSWLNELFSSASDGASVKVVKKSFEYYNSYNDSEYLALMDPNINYFMTNGLGTTRFASGILEFKTYVSPILRKKKSKIEVLGIFDLTPWVIVHQRTIHEWATLEASVSYKVQGDKITDILILGEKRVDEQASTNKQSQ